MLSKCACDVVLSGTRYHTHKEKCEVAQEVSNRLSNLPPSELYKAATDPERKIEKQITNEVRQKFGLLAR